MLLEIIFNCHLDESVHVPIESFHKCDHNEVILQLIYEDLSKKLDFISGIYPHFKHGLLMYDIMFKHFGIEYSPIIRLNDGIERFRDTYEECMKAFDNNTFNVEHDYFGNGEWPIILFDRLHRESSDEDLISYTITR